MRLVARTPKAKFEVPQKLLQQNQKAYLCSKDDHDPEIRIRTEWIGAYRAYDNPYETEITSADQLVEEEYKIS